MSITPTFMVAKRRVIEEMTDSDANKSDVSLETDCSQLVQTSVQF